MSSTIVYIGQLRISGLKWERVLIVVKLSAPVSIFLYIYIFLFLTICTGRTVGRIETPLTTPYQVASWSIQPFGHNYTPTSQTDKRADRTTADSIGRTALQTVAKNTGRLCQKQNLPQFTACGKKRAISHSDSQLPTGRCFTSHCTSRK